MNHREFLQSLSNEQRRALTQRNNRYAIVRLLVLLTCFAICTSAIITRLPLLPMWLLAQGLLLVSLFHLMHECIHDTVFEKQWPNRVLAHMCGLLLFLPSSWFRYFHRAHHRYTQQADKDPELTSKKPHNLLQWGIHISGITIWRSQLWLLLGALIRPIRESYIKESKQTSVRAEMLLMLAVYVGLATLSVIFKSSLLLYVWIYPLVLGQPFLRLYLLAEHTGCESGANMLKNTRTVLTNPVVRWFTWNMPYHTEHHVYPSVPFHQLPKLHELMETEQPVVDAGYIQFNTGYVKHVMGANK